MLPETPVPFLKNRDENCAKLYTWSYLISRTSPGLAQVTAELPFLEIAARTPPLGLSVLGPHPSGRVGDSQTLRPSWDLRPALPSTERQPEALVWRLPGQAHSGSHVPKPAQLRRAPWSNNTRAACFLLLSVKTETQAQRLAEQKHLFLPPGPIPRVWSRACNHQPGSQGQCSSLLGSRARLVRVRCAVPGRSDDAMRNGREVPSAAPGPR